MTIEYLTVVVIFLFFIRGAFAEKQTGRIEDRIKRLYAEVEKIKKHLNVKE